MLTGKGVNGEQQEVKYWDPAASSLKKAQDIVNAEGYTGPALAADNSNYFEIVSANYLGTTQTTQFQSGNQQGSAWHWGSKCTDVGVCDQSAEPSNVRALVEMPRGYHHGNNVFGGYYNWYAVTAESGKLSMSAGETANDSVCPSGWSMPEYETGIGRKSFRQLLSVAYSLLNNADSAKIVRKTPLSFVWAGEYAPRLGTLDYTNQTGFLATNTKRTETAVWHTMYRETSLYAGDSNNANMGHTVRCVLE